MGIDCHSGGHTFLLLRFHKNAHNRFCLFTIIILLLLYYYIFVLLLVASGSGDVCNGHGTADFKINSILNVNDAK